MRQFSINYLGQKVIIFFQELHFGGRLFLCIEGTKSVINTRYPQKKTELKKIGGTCTVSSIACYDFMLKILSRLLLTSCSLLFGECKSAHPQHNETAIKITQQHKSYLLPFCFPIFIPFYGHTFCVQVNATYH